MKLKQRKDDFNTSIIPMITDKNQELRDIIKDILAAVLERSNKIVKTNKMNSADSKDDSHYQCDEYGDIQLQTPSNIDHSTDPKGDLLSQCYEHGDTQIQTVSITNNLSNEKSASLSKCYEQQDTQFQTPSTTNHSNDVKVDSHFKCYKKEDTKLQKLPIDDYLTDVNSDLHPKCYEQEDTQLKTPSIIDNLTDLKGDLLPHSYEHGNTQCQMFSITDDQIPKCYKSEDTQCWTPLQAYQSTDIMGASLLSTRPNMPPITRPARFKLTIVVLYHWMFIYLLILEGSVVNAKPDFSYEPPPSISIKEGYSVSMTCLLNKEAASFEVVWTKDSHYIDNPNCFFLSNDNSRQYTLQIYPVKREDEGIYKCIGNKESGTLHDTIFSSGCHLVVIKIPGPQYPQVILSQSRYNVGEDIDAYCISERVDHPSKITWLNSPDVGLIEQFENSSHVGVAIRFKASEEVNQTTILCKMIVDGVATPRFKRSMPIVVNPILQEVVKNFESTSISAVVLTNNSDRINEDTVASDGNGIEYMSLIIMFTCLIVFSILAK